ncbi:GTP-binding protein [Candidatus Parvarchaeota archaeon]|nr:GTP-binding protein [Candidatus Parvarchaeota archaeon]
MIGKIIGFIKKLFGFGSRKKDLAIGFYGSPNVGKTTLANTICLDLLGEPMGKVSVVPHETRAIHKKERVTLKMNGYILSMNLLDMPGIAVKVDYRDFLNYGLSVQQAQARAKEATRGIIEAVRFMNNVDAALVVLDATQDPYSQVNATILGNLEAKDIPIVIVANKMDLVEAKPELIRDAFPQYPVIEISAATGQNIEELYEAIATKIK